MDNQEKRRKIKISFRVNENEKRFIEEKAKLSGNTSTGAYIRKMAISGIVVKYESKEIKKIRKSLGGIQKNINQMAIRVNATNRIYEEDFEYLKEVMSDIWQSLISIQSKLHSASQ